MKTKMFEVRDEGTLIPVIAYRMNPDNEAQQALLARGGYGSDAEGQAEYVWLQRFDAGYGQGMSDVFKWGTRTMHEAHIYIKANFDELRDGDVVDVQFILGETKEKKVSEIQ